MTCGVIERAGEKERKKWEVRKETSSPQVKGHLKKKKKKKKKKDSITKRNANKREKVSEKREKWPKCPQVTCGHNACLHGRPNCLLRGRLRGYYLLADVFSSSHITE